MTPVTEYVKNLGKSFKYATFKYLEREAPAITEFTNTNEELFRDVFHSIRDLKGTYRKATRAIQSTNIYQAGNTAFENALSDLKSGKFYNKEREDRAMNDSFGFEDGDMDMSMDNFDQEGSAQSMSAGERAIGSAVTSSSARSAARVAGTVEASARYMVENAKANTNMLYQQMTNTNNIMNSGFKGMMSGLDTLNQFNNTVMQTLAENSIEFFYEDGISLRVCNYAPNNRSKNLLKVEVRSYNNKGYSKSSDIAIKVWTEKHEYFDINKLLGEEANEILNKIKALIDPKTIKKIVSKYFKKSDNGYEKKSDKFNDRIINYEDIK